MNITEDMIKAGQDALKSTFEGYGVRYSEYICDYHDCTDGNHLLCADGVIRRFRRYINVRRKTIYWCYPTDEYRRTVFNLN